MPDIVSHLVVNGRLNHKKAGTENLPTMCKSERDSVCAVLKFTFRIP